MVVVCGVVLCVCRCFRASRSAGEVVPMLWPSTLCPSIDMWVNSFSRVILLVFAPFLIRNHNDAFFSSATCLTCRPPKRSGDPSTRPATVPRCLPPVPAQQGPRGLLGESKPLRRACVAYLRAWRALVETNPIAFI